MDVKATVSVVITFNKIKLFTIIIALIGNLYCGYNLVLCCLDFHCIPVILFNLWFMCPSSKSKRNLITMLIN